MPDCPEGGAAFGYQFKTLKGLVNRPGRRRLKGPVLARRGLRRRPTAARPAARTLRARAPVRLECAGPSPAAPRPQASPTRRARTSPREPPAPGPLSDKRVMGASRLPAAPFSALSRSTLTRGTRPGRPARGSQGPIPPEGPLLRVPGPARGQRGVGPTSRRNPATTGAAPPPSPAPDLVEARPGSETPVPVDARPHSLVGGPGVHSGTGEGWNVKRRGVTRTTGKRRLPRGSQLLPTPPLASLSTNSPAPDHAVPSSIITHKEKGGKKSPAPPGTPPPPPFRSPYRVLSRPRRPLVNRDRDKSTGVGTV